MSDSNDDTKTSRSRSVIVVPELDGNGLIDVTEWNKPVSLAKPNGPTVRATVTELLEDSHRFWSIYNEKWEPYLDETQPYDEHNLGRAYTVFVRQGLIEKAKAAEARFLRHHIDRQQRLSGKMQYMDWIREHGFQNLQGNQHPWVLACVGGHLKMAWHLEQKFVSKAYLHQHLALRLIAEEGDISGVEDFLSFLRKRDRLSGNPVMFHKDRVPLVLPSLRHGPMAEFLIRYFGMDVAGFRFKGYNLLQLVAMKFDERYPQQASLEQIVDADLRYMNRIKTRCIDTYYLGGVEVTRALVKHCGSASDRVMNKMDAGGTPVQIAAGVGYVPLLRYYVEETQCDLTGVADIVHSTENEAVIAAFKTMKRPSL